MDIRPKKSRDVLTVGDYNALRAQAIRETLGGFGIESGDTGAGNVLATWPVAERRAFCVEGLLQHDSFVPQFGVVHITGYSNDPAVDRNEPFYHCRWPQQTGFLGLGIAQNQSLLTDDIGWLQVAGLTPVLYDPTTIPAEFVTPAGIPTTGVGVRLGARRASFMAQYDPLGPLLVVGLLLGAISSTTPGGDTYISATAVCRFICHRGGSIHCSHDDGSHIRQTPAFVIRPE